MCDFGKGGLECSWGKQGLYSQNSKRSSKINGRRGTHPTVQNGRCPHYGKRSGESGERLPLSWEFVFTVLFLLGRWMCVLGGLGILSRLRGSRALSDSPSLTQFSDALSSLEYLSNPGVASSSSRSRRSLLLD